MSIMKRRIITAVLCVALAVMFIMSPYMRYYSKSGRVLQISGNLVTVVDGSHHLWLFFGAEDYDVGDLVSLLMYDNLTPSIFDDTIVKVQYAGNL